MIRVLNIVETMAFGGVERRRLSLARHLNKEMFELKIICTKATGEMIEEFRKEGVEVIPVGILKSPFQWSQHRKVQQIIADFKPHIIHGAVFEGVTMASINGFIKRVPIVILEETSDPQNRSWKGNLLMRFLTLPATKVVGVSKASTDYLENTLNINSKKVILIENGVAIPEPENYLEIAKIRERLQLEGKIVTGSVGRMLNDSTKRFSDLIKAFAKLKKQQPNVHLLLVGDGPERSNYENLVKELDLQENVTFEGYQNKVAPYYNVMDVFSLVSAHESFGLVLVEAMLAKLPVVATKVGGMKYIIEDEKTGFLVEKYDVNDIADKLEKLCQDQVLRKQMGETGYKRAVSNYTEEKYVEKVQNLYSQLLADKKIKP